MTVSRAVCLVIECPLGELSFYSVSWLPYNPGQANERYFFTASEQTDFILGEGGLKLQDFPPLSNGSGRSYSHTQLTLFANFFPFFPTKEGAWSQARESLDCMRTGAIFRHFSGQHKVHMEQLYLSRPSRAPYLLHAELKNEDHV